MPTSATNKQPFSSSRYPSSFFFLKDNHAPSHLASGHIFNCARACSLTIHPCDVALQLTMKSQLEEIRGQLQEKKDECAKLHGSVEDLEAENIDLKRDLMRRSEVRVTYEDAQTPADGTRRLFLGCW
mmetsp:Transcript_96570/g.275576  ORF Transcript_96570/g.275576 Transcript_96570/m.275576 type:complete len:127 (-) Transcript_96570:532-912(-)